MLWPRTKIYCKDKALLLGFKNLIALLKVSFNKLTVCLDQLIFLTFLLVISSVTFFYFSPYAPKRIYNFPFEKHVYRMTHALAN